MLHSKGPFAPQKIPDLLGLGLKTLKLGVHKESRVLAKPLNGRDKHVTSQLERIDKSQNQSKLPPINHKWVMLYTLHRS